MDWPLPPLPGRLYIEGEHPFVGRRDELETIETAWDVVKEGRRQVVFVGGEPGAGKTRLVTETAAALHADGATVLFGSSFADYSVPYQPFVEILDRVFDSAGKSVWNSIPDSARHLLRLIPRIAEHRPDLRPSDREDERRDLFGAFAELVGVLAEPRPLALVLEDLHWAQEPTRQLLTHLIQTISEERLLIIGTFRTTAPDRELSLTKMIADLYRLPGVKRIDLAGLEVTDIAILIGASGNFSRGERLSSAVLLHDQTGGNPFFVCELISHGVSGPDRPATIIDALDARLATLSAAATRAVELAGVLGDEFDSLTLSAASDQENDVLDGLDEAIQSGLIVKRPGDGSLFQFTHSLTRQAVIERMTSARRARAHAAVAEAIERTTSPSGQRHAELAHHYRLANNPKRATEEAAEAARYAEESLAYEEAAYWYRRAAEADEPRRDEWLLAAASNLVNSGDFGTGRNLFRNLLDSPDEKLVARAALGFEEACFFEGLDGHEATMVIDRALERISPDPHDPGYVLLLARKGRALFFAGDPGATAVVDKAIDMAVTIGNERLLFATWIASINNSLLPGHSHEHGESLRRAFDWAVGSGTRSEIINAATVLAALAYFKGDPGTYAEARDTSLRISALTDFTFWSAVVSCMTCSDHFQRGELELARAVAIETRRKGKRAGVRFDEGPFGLQMFLIEREAGRLEAVRTVAEAIETSSSLWEPGLIAMYIELDLPVRAKEALESFIEQPLDTRRDPALWPAGLALIAEAVISLNHHVGAGIVRPELLLYSGLNLMSAAMVAAFGAADRYLAQLDAILGLPSAEHHFQTALEMDRRMGATLHEVETLIAYAAYLERSTDHRHLARATEYRQRARSLAERKGLVRQLRRLDASTTVRSDRPAGLTPREIEVLRLIAEGLSNNDIAERLFISQNTAANHVRSILTKTQAPNRTKAAIFAAENGLLG